jgi:hypothetical protein
MKDEVTVLISISRLNYEFKIIKIKLYEFIYIYIYMSIACLIIDFNFMFVVSSIINYLIGVFSHKEFSIHLTTFTLLSQKNSKFILLLQFISY